MGLNKRLIGAGATAGAGGITPSENFKVVTWTGNGSSQTIEVGFKPDFIWAKDRVSAGEWHLLSDSTRGTNSQLFSNAQNAQDTKSTVITSFDSTGFSIGSDNLVNNSGKTYVAWCWKAAEGTTTSVTGTNISSATQQVNTNIDFSITQFTEGSSGTSAVPHGLSGTPDMYIVKRTGGAQDWYVWHNGLSAGNSYIILNSTSAQGSNNNMWTQVDSTNINLGPWNTEGGGTKIIYAFKNVEGFSKFGTYTGTGGNLIVETGFEPAYLMIKRTDAANYDWYILDNKRNPIDYRNTILRANSADAESTVTNGDIDVKFLSNGFSFDDIPSSSAGFNATGGTYIYMAFAADPDTEAPTLESSFNIETYTGNGTSLDINTGFKPGLIWTKPRSYSDHHQLWDIVRGAGWTVYSDTTHAENPTIRLDGVSSFNDNGFSIGDWNNINVNNADHVAWVWKTDDNEATIGKVTEDLDAVAIYKFEDNADDVTGNFDGTASNVTYNASGKFNKAGDFNGSTSNFTYPEETININESHTISGWVYLDTLQDEDMLFYNHDTNVRLRGNYSVKYRRNLVNTAYDINSSTTLSASTWYHIVITFDTTNGMALYINGSLEGTNSYTGNASNHSSDYGLMYRADNGGQRTDGRMDQVRIYDKALTASNVATLYAETAAQNNSLSLGMTYVAGTQSIVSANANAGFSIVKYEGTGSATTVPHGLSAAPNMILVKNLSNTHSGNAHWAVYHTSVGATKVIYLNRDNAEGTSSAFWNDTAPSSTSFSIGTDNDVNVNNEDFIAYCFHDVTGYQKFGSYSGNGSTQSITGLGFKPDFVMLKRSSGTGNWNIYDSRRGQPMLRANTDNSEFSGLRLSFESDGFKLEDNDADRNASGSTYIYWAIAKNIPINTTLADSFKILTYTGTGANQKVEGLGFRPDLVWIKSRSTTNTHQLHDAARGIGQTLKSSDIAAEVNESQYFTGVGDGYLQFGTNAGNYNNTGTNYVAWAWKAGNTWQSNIDGTIPSITNTNTANGLSIVKYTGTGSTGTYGHGLSSSPNLIITKRLDASEGWLVWFSSLPASNYMYLNSSGTGGTDANAYKTIGSTTNQIGSDGTVNTSGGEYISYVFHSVSGYSKFSSYTGNGSTQSITGLGFKPDFVMTKGRTSADNWFIFDSVRGDSVTVNANLNAAEYADTGVTSFDSDGFTLGSGAGENRNGDTYVYMAFKMNPTPLPLTGNMSFLVIAGGGSGGNRHGGGGGAGGFRTSYGNTSGGGASAESDITLSAGTYTITIGAGGAGTTYNTTAGNNGAVSSIAASGLTTISSTGGGGGGIYHQPTGAHIDGSDGGSGGGGGSASSKGVGTANQGYNGGDGGGQNAPDYGGAGGGGASAIGNNGSGSGGGNGGAGLAVEITGSSVAYAGGGGGSSFTNHSARGTGGNGGGGDGAGNLNTGGSGTANTGGGGGGTTYDGGYSGAGGSGVVILRLLTSEYSGTTTGSPTVTTDGNHTIIKYTGSGTYVHS